MRSIIKKTKRFRDMKTKEEAINDKVSKILEMFSFDNIQAKSPEFCPCYNEGKFCHSTKNKNCFFCFCPEYDNSKEEGGCKILSTKGKWFFDGKLPKGKIWDCSDCDYPHQKENAEKMLKRLFQG
jgi:Zn-finger protein